MIINKINYQITIIFNNSYMTVIFNKWQITIIFNNSYMTVIFNKWQIGITFKLFLHDSYF
jgi:hypothetical protein